MKWVISFLALCFTLVSCSTQDEPQNNQEPVSVWYVTFVEMNYFQFSENISNTSEECLDWKATYNEFCLNNFRNDSFEYWEWQITFDNLTETQVINKVDEFINFTIWPYDLFSAIVAYDGYYVIHSCRKVDENNTSNKWKITFYERRSIKDDKYLTPPVNYDKWVKEHEKYLVSEIQGESEDYYTWEMELDSLTQQDIKELIIPFVKMSCGGIYNGSPSYYKFEVEVYQYNSNKLMYYKPINY